MPKFPKVPDEYIIKLNDLGLSLESIGRQFGYHPSTIKHRLTKLGIEAADTRRTFAEKIYKRLTPNEREWLSDTLHLGQPIDAFIASLIKQEYVKRLPKCPTNDQPKASNPD